MAPDIATLCWCRHNSSQWRKRLSLVPEPKHRRGCAFLWKVCSRSPDGSAIAMTYECYCPFTYLLITHLPLLSQCSLKKAPVPIQYAVPEEGHADTVLQPVIFEHINVAQMNALDPFDFPVSSSLFWQIILCHIIPTICLSMNHRAMSLCVCYALIVPSNVTGRRL